MEQLTFGSDEFTSSISLKNTEDKELSYDLAYKIYEQNEISDQPLIVFKSTCDSDFLLVFSIHDLTKKTLQIIFQATLSSNDIQIKNKTITFERIAGPSENME